MANFKIKGSIKSKLLSFLFLLISISIVFAIFTNVKKTRQIVLVPAINKDIEYGEIISDADIKMVEVGVYNMPGKIIREKDTIVGHYASMQLHKDRYVYEEDLLTVKPALTIKEQIANSAVAIETDLIKCVGGVPEAGDYVRIAIIKTDTDIIVERPKELSKVKILAIQNSNGKYIKDVRSKKESSFTGAQETVRPSLILFDVTPIQEVKLLEGLYSGTLHLILHSEENQNKEFIVEGFANEKIETELKQLAKLNTGEALTIVE